MPYYRQSEFSPHCQMNMLIFRIFRCYAVPEVCLLNLPPCDHQAEMNVVRTAEGNARIRVVREQRRQLMMSANCGGLCF